MKTFETEKHDIPEGATHYSDETRSARFAWKNGKDECQFPCIDCEWEIDMAASTRDWQPIPQTNIETPEEKEVEWKSGDKCVYMSDEFLFVGMIPTLDDFSCVIFSDTHGAKRATTIELSKPETQQQREERERLENGQSLYELVQYLWCTVDSKYTPHPYSSPMVDDKTKEMYARLARAVDYRKEG